LKVPRSTVSAEAGSMVRRTMGTAWNQVPFSPAGSRPIRRASAAMKSVAFTLPGVPERRPCIESSA
jgi:hypothetical protein